MKYAIGILKLVGGVVILEIGQPILIRQLAEKDPRAGACTLSKTVSVVGDSSLLCSPFCLLWKNEACSTNIISLRVTLRIDFYFF